LVQRCNYQYRRGFYVGWARQKSNARRAEQIDTKYQFMYSVQKDWRHMNESVGMLAEARGCGPGTSRLWRAGGQASETGELAVAAPHVPQVNKRDGSTPSKPWTRACLTFLAHHHISPIAAVSHHIDCRIRCFVRVKCAGCRSLSCFFWLYLQRIASHRVSTHHSPTHGLLDDPSAASRLPRPRSILHRLKSATP